MAARRKAPAKKAPAKKAPAKKAPAKKKPIKKGVPVDENGGETIKVVIYVNGKPKFYRAASLTGAKGPNMRRYVTDDGEVIRHNRKQGYKRLVAKIINA